MPRLLYFQPHGRQLDFATIHDEYSNVYSFHFNKGGGVDYTMSHRCLADGVSYGEGSGTGGSWCLDRHIGVSRG